MPGGRCCNASEAGPRRADVGRSNVGRRDVMQADETVPARPAARRALAGALRHRSGRHPRAPDPGGDLADAQRLPARPRPHHPFLGLPAPQAQDPGLRPPRGRPLPDPADPHPGGEPDRPGARPGARPRRGPRGGAGAQPRPRPHLLRAYRARTPWMPAWRTMAASTTTPRPCASSPGWSGATPASTGSTSPGRPWRASSSTTARCWSRTGARPGAGPARGIPAAILEYDALNDLELARFAGPEAQAAALADDIAYDSHDLDDGLRAGLFDLADLARGAVPARACSTRSTRLHPASSPRARSTSWRGASSPASSRT